MSDVEKRDVEYSEGLVIKDCDSELAGELEALAELKALKADPMDLVRFYRGEIKTGGGAYVAEGWSFDDIMDFDYSQMETCHRWTQWVWPTKERSFFQPDVPLLNNDVINIFREDGELQNKVTQAFLKTLDFYGFKLEGEEEKVVLQEAGWHHENPLWAIQHFNHNYLRLTRILTSVRYIGHEPWSVSFKEALLEHAKYDVETKMYWEHAAASELP